MLCQVGYDFLLLQYDPVRLLRNVFKVDLERLRLAKGAAQRHVPLLVGRLRWREFPNHRAARHLDHEFLAAAPGFALTFAGAAVLGVEVRCVKLGDEIVDVVVGLQNDIATLTTVAATRPALRLERFMRKCEATVASLAGPGLDLD